MPGAMDKDEEDEEDEEEDEDEDLSFLSEPENILSILQ